MSLFQPGILKNHKIRRRIIFSWLIAFSSYCIIFIGCGADTNRSNSNPQIPNPPATETPVSRNIRMIAPSKVMIGGGEITSMEIYGEGTFDRGPLVYIDGIQVHTIGVQYFGGAFLEVDLRRWDGDLYQDQPGIHTVEVVSNGVKSDAVSLEFYHPARGPKQFEAIESNFLSNITGAPPTQIEICDLNEDNIEDVIVLGYGSPSNFTILNGNGDGSLGVERSVDLEFSTRHIFCEDINSDGHKDILALSRRDLEFFINDGSGNFQNTLQPVSYYYQNEKVLLEDINGDGAKDLVVHDPYHDKVSISINSGGIFQPRYDIFSRIVNGRSGDYVLEPVEQVFHVADFNKDGRNDILFVSYHSDPVRFEFSFLMQQQGGLFEEVIPGLPSFTLENKKHATVIDYDRDGYPDIAIGGRSSPSNFELEIYLNLGDGSFVPVSGNTISTSFDSSMYRMVAGDFDGDGHTDMVGINNGPTSSESTEEVITLFWWGDGIGNFQPEDVWGPNGFIASTGDVNGDGITDAVIGNYWGTVSVLIGNENRLFPQPVLYSSGGSGPLSAADINSDGFVDLLVAGNYSESIQGTVYMNDGHGTFLPGISVSPSILVMADLNGDGSADMAGPEGVCFGYGLGDFTSSQTWIEPGISQLDQWQILDMNLDGLLDIVVGTPEFTGGYIIYGGDTLPLASIGSPSVRFQRPFIADRFNLDALPDILSSIMPGVLLGSDVGYPMSHIDKNMGAGLKMASGDFNGDHYADVVNGLSVYINDNLRFYRKGILSGIDNVGGVAVQDFNGDGWMDILVSSYDDNYLALFTNDGNEKFSCSYFAASVLTDYWNREDFYMIQTDFNNDSWPDVALSGGGKTAVILHK